MILATHIVIAQAAAKKIAGGNIILGFVIGWISHYLADLIPHREYTINSVGAEGVRLNISKHERYNDYLRVLADAAIGFLIGVGFVYPVHNWHDLVYVSAVTFGGVLPDLMQFLYKFKGWKFLLPLDRLQDFMHARVGLKNYPLLGIVSQTAITVIAIYLGK